MEAENGRTSGAGKAPVGGAELGNAPSLAGQYTLWAWPHWNPIRDS